MQETALKLGVQLFIGNSKPDPKRMHVIMQPRGWMKPISGGIWTSTYQADTYSSAWNDFCLRKLSDGKAFKDTWLSSWWLLTPQEQCNLYVIDSFADFQKCLNTYSYECDGKRFIDFAALSLIGFDAFHVTEQGYKETQHDYPDNLSLWSCESTLWFRWCFTKMEQT